MTAYVNLEGIPARKGWEVNRANDAPRYPTKTTE